jgi:L-amino acid N-acyltransferase YncA
MKKPNELRFLDPEGRLKLWPSKHYDKVLVLAYLATKFEYDVTYTESQVNSLLKQWHSFTDWPLLRRELIDRGYLERNRDGSRYTLKQLSTDLAGLTLVRPNIDQDAHISVQWLEGPAGRDTLRLMGNTNEHNQPSTLEEEQDRLRDFVTATNQITWMLRYKGSTVGAVWISLDASKYLQAPSLHIMIGQPDVRGQGIGSAAMKALIQQLQFDASYEYVHSRYLKDNEASANLLRHAGFIEDGSPYQDDDGLSFQNVRLDLQA